MPPPPQEERDGPTNARIVQATIDLYVALALADDPRAAAWLRLRAAALRFAEAAGASGLSAPSARDVVAEAVRRWAAPEMPSGRRVRLEGALDRWIGTAYRLRRAVGGPAMIVMVAAPPRIVEASSGRMAEREAVRTACRMARQEGCRTASMLREAVRRACQEAAGACARARELHAVAARLRAEAHRALRTSPPRQCEPPGYVGHVTP